MAGHESAAAVTAGASDWNSKATSPAAEAKGAPEVVYGRSGIPLIGLGQTTTPKGRTRRTLAMTDTLVAALKALDMIRTGFVIRTSTARR